MIDAALLHQLRSMNLQAWELFMATHVVGSLSIFGRHVTVNYGIYSTVQRINKEAAMQLRTVCRRQKVVRGRFDPDRVVEEFMGWLRGQLPRPKPKFAFGRLIGR